MLGVRLTKYQQIHSDIQPAVQQMFTCLFTYLLEPLLYVPLSSNLVILPHLVENVGLVSCSVNHNSLHGLFVVVVVVVVVVCVCVCVCVCEPHGTNTFGRDRDKDRERERERDRQRERERLIER